MFKSCQHRCHVQQQKTTQTMFAPLAFYYIKITVSQKKLRVTLIQISTHLYSPLFQKERQNVEKGPRKSNTWKLNTWYISWRNNPFLWRASAVSMSVRNWNFLQLINLIIKNVTAFLQMLHMVWLHFCFWIFWSIMEEKWLARLALLKMKDELGSSFVLLGERNKDRQTDQKAKPGHWPNQLFVSCQSFQSTFVPLTKLSSPFIQLFA